MIVYSETLGTFKSDCYEGILVDKLDRILRTSYRGSSYNEIMSWENSLSQVERVMAHTDLPDNVGVAIEYMIPSTSKRIDFLLSGYDSKDKESVVIIELKQWSHASAVIGKGDIVKTFVGRANREVPHPSYQAWSYAELLRNFNEKVEEGDINLYPCAFLHNYRFQEHDEPLLMDCYQETILKSPLFSKLDQKKLVNFLNHRILKGDDRKILYEIENGKIRPSKSLQDSLVSMISGNKEFTMIDDQKVVYEKAISLAQKCQNDGKKRTLIVEGGPGTGKSVISVNLLVELIRRGMVTAYTSKNRAPREVYSTKLKGTYNRKTIDALFMGAGSFKKLETNSFGGIIVDEAHRLSKKSNFFDKEGNQIREIIKASQFSVFFVDDHQIISTQDIGTKEAILHEAEQQGSIVLTDKLESQFRCNGSDGYLAWVDDLLQIRKTANPILDIDYDFDVMDNPNDLYQWVESHNENNKARILAGYCWEWPKAGRGDDQEHDIQIPEYDFSMSWNLSNHIWAISPDSVNEAGCIHTSQGLEFDYVGIIIGPDMYVEDGVVITNFFNRAKSDQSVKGLKGLYKTDPKSAMSKGDEIIKNTYRTLLTRGMKGCRVFCTDPNLREYIKDRMNAKNIYKPRVDEGELAAENLAKYETK